jgi:hypothetical protein
MNAHQDESMPDPNALMAAVARVKITPKIGDPLQGYHDSENPAERVKDDTYARLLLLEQGGRRVLIVNVDLCFSSEDPFIDRTGRRLSPPFPPGTRERWGYAAKADVVFVAATHTHYAQVTTSTDVQAAILAGIRELKRNLQPVKVSVATGRCGLSACRRPDLLPHPEVEIDRSMGVLRLVTERDQPLALLVNFGVHLTMPGDPRAVTAEFAGLAMKRFEEAGEEGAFFLQGFSGDVCSVWQRSGGAPYDAVVAASQELITAIVQVVRELRPVDAGSMEAYWEEFAVPAELLVDANKPLKMGIGGLRLGPLAMLAVSGEVFEISGPKVRERAQEYGLNPVFTVGHVNGYCGYIPSREAYEGGTYSYEMGSTPFTRGIEGFMLAKLEEMCLRLEP